jgi:acyl-CoA reductase-like NAD-dependent aldehyde dehydrogenase
MEGALTYSDFKFLKELGIEENNIGCYYNGKWAANGDDYTCMNPSTGKAVSKVKFANADDYEKCMEAMAEEKDRWMTTPAP